MVCWGFEIQDPGISFPFSSESLYYFLKLYVCMSDLTLNAVKHILLICLLLLDGQRKLVY